MKTWIPNWFRLNLNDICRLKKDIIWTRQRQIKLKFRPFDQRFTKKSSKKILLQFTLKSFRTSVYCFLWAKRPCKKDLDKKILNKTQTNPFKALNSLWNLSGRFLWARLWSCSRKFCSQHFRRFSRKNYFWENDC